jgi:hypothetical protein
VVAGGRERTGGRGRGQDAEPQQNGGESRGQTKSYARVGV